MTIPHGGGISRKSTRLPRFPTAEIENVVHSGTSWRKRAVRRPAVVVFTILTRGCPSSTSRSVTRSFDLNRVPETTTAPGVVTVSVGRMPAAVDADAAVTTSAPTTKASVRLETNGRTASVYPSRKQIRPARYPFTSALPTARYHQNSFNLQRDVRATRVLPACQGRDIAFCSACPKSFDDASSMRRNGRAGASTRRSSRGSRRA